MRKFIINYKWIIVIVVIVICCVGGILFINSGINGQLISCSRSESFINNFVRSESASEFHEEFKNFFNMEQEVVEEMYKNPERYTTYWIVVNIYNDASYKIYDVRPSLGTKFDNMWIRQDTFSDFSLDLEAGQNYIHSVAIIIRTEGMTDDEIDNLIKSVGITISANILADSFPIVASKTIYFNK